MSLPYDPTRSTSMTVYPEDLDSGLKLYGLLVAVARTLGRKVDPTTADLTTAVRAGDELLVALGLVAPGQPPVPDGVEGIHIGTRHHQ